MSGITPRHQDLTCSSVYQMHLSIVLSLVCSQQVLTCLFVLPPYVITPWALFYDEDEGSSLEKPQGCQKLYISISDTVIKKNDYQYLQLAIKDLNQIYNRNTTYLYYMRAQCCVLSQLHVRLLLEDKCKKYLEDKCILYMLYYLLYCFSI